MGDILPGGTVRVEIGEQWFDLRQYIGWFEIESNDPQAPGNFRIGLPAHIMSRIEKGAGLDELDPDMPVDIQVPGAELALKRLKARLCGWSYRQPINEGNIKHLSPGITRRLLARIDELDEAERQAGEHLEEGHPFEPSSAS